MEFFAAKPEFSFISELLGPGRLRRDALGPGDDACLLPQGDGRHLALSTDASAEGIHYRLDWYSLETAIHRSVLANLSDINAMGGHTTHLLLALGLKPGWGMAEASMIGSELQRLAKQHGFAIAGGDTIRTARDSFFSFTVCGQILGKPLLRSQVRPGHTLYVTHGLGHAASGLACLQAGHTAMAPAAPSIAKAIEAHIHPVPPLALGPALAALGKDVGAIDLSDGLSSELWHLSRQSSCRLTVEWSKLPYDTDIVEVLDPQRKKDRVLHGGEEYQLLFSGDFSEKEIQALNAIAPCHAIGFAETGAGVFLSEASGAVIELSPGGFSH